VSSAQGWIFWRLVPSTHGWIAAPVDGSGARTVGIMMAWCADNPSVRDLPRDALLRARLPKDFPMTCPTCGAVAQRNATYCSRCATPLHAPPPLIRRSRNSTLGALAFGVLLVFVVVSLVAGVINRDVGSPDGPTPDFAASAPGATSPPSTVTPSDLLHAHADEGHRVATTTSAFTASGTWQEQYSYECGTRSTPAPLSIQVVPATGRNHFIDIAATQPSSNGQGSHRVHASGRFRLLVRIPQNCAWTITVRR
jgi:hypothetical protein